MEKFIPYEKLSKKKQRELNAARRGTWTINPVTRKPANPKAYNRKTARKWKDDSNSVPFDSLTAKPHTGFNNIEIFEEEHGDTELSEEAGLGH